jgi:hypothetical protein
LDADDLVVGGENIFLPEIRLVVFAVTMVVAGVTIRHQAFAKRRELLNSRFHMIYLTLSQTRAASNNGR